MDSSLTAALGVGFLLGLRHALDADHVAAVAVDLLRAYAPARPVRLLGVRVASFASADGQLALTL